MTRKYNKVIDYLTYIENEVYTKQETDDRDFLNFEPKIGSGDNNTVVYTTNGRILNIQDTRIFLGGFSHMLGNTSLTVPPSSTVYVCVEKGSGRDDIAVAYTLTPQQNTFSKMYIASVSTNASSITNVDAYVVTPHGSFSSAEQVATYTQRLNIFGSATITIPLSQFPEINESGKDFLDTIIEYSIYDSNNNRYLLNHNSIILSIDNTKKILSLTNSSGIQRTIDLTVIG